MAMAGFFSNADGYRILQWVSVYGMNGIQHLLSTGLRPLDQRLAQRGLGIRLMEFLLSSRMTPLQQARYLDMDRDQTGLALDITEQGREETSPPSDAPK